MTPILILIQPWDQVANARIDVLLADALDGDAYGLGGLRWKPGIHTRPALSMDLISPTLEGRLFAGTAQFEISLSALGIAPDVKLKWDGAPVTIWTARALQWPGDVEFEGYVSQVRNDVLGRTVRLECAVALLKSIEKPLLVLEYDGAGGADGDADKRGTLKPMGCGIVDGIEPVWFDLTNWIGCIDGYGNTVSISRLMEGASSMGASVGDYATYAALAAAIVAHAVPPGRWATCIAEGLVGLGAPPTGVIQVDAVFGHNRLGSMMKRIISTHAVIGSGDIDDASFDDMDADLPYPTTYWTASQVQIKDILERMAASGNSSLILTLQGKIAVTRSVTTASQGTLDDSGGQLPRVVETESMEREKPVWRIRARTSRPARVLSYDEVKYGDDIIDTGLYSNTKVYREGNIVWLSDKSSWLFINATPSAGHLPPTWPTTSNAYWTNMTPPTAAAALGSNQFANYAFRDGLNQWARFWGGLANNSTLTMSSGKAVLASAAPLNPSGALGDGFGSLSASDGSALFGGHRLFRVIPGQRIALRIKAVASANGALVPYFRFLALAPGSDLAGSSGGTAFSGFGANITPANSNVASYIDVPAGAYWLDIEFYGYVYSSTAAVSITLEALQLSFIDPDQTVPPVWAEGPTGAYRADVTSEKTSLDTANVGGIPTATLLTTIANIGSDAVLSRGEKPDIIIQWNALYANYLALNAKANSLGGLGAIQVAATSDINALGAYLSSLSPPWFDTTTDSAISASAWQTAWQNAYTTVAALQAAIQGQPGASFTLVPHANVSVGTDSIVKTAGGSAWNASAYSAEAYVGGAFATIKAPNPAVGGTFFGLNTDPLTNASYDTIDFAIYCEAGGALYRYQNGSGAALGTYALDDILTVHYDGPNVRYLKNGTLLYTNVNQAEGQRFFFDSSLANPGNRIDGIKFGPSGAAGNSPYQVSSSASTWIVRTDPYGAVKAGQVPQITTMSVKRGSLDVTGSATFYIASNDGSVTGSISSPTISLTGAGTDGWIDIAAHIAGVEVGRVRVQVKRVADPLPPESQSSFSADIYEGGVSGTSFNIASSTIGILKVGAAGQLKGSAAADYIPSGGTEVFMALAIAYRVAGTSTWSFTTTANGTRGGYDPGTEEWTSGFVATSPTISGLTPGILYEIAPAYKRNASVASAAVFNLAFTGEVL